MTANRHLINKPTPLAFGLVAHQRSCDRIVTVTCDLHRRSPIGQLQSRLGIINPISGRRQLGYGDVEHKTVVGLNGDRRKFGFGRHDKFLNRFKGSAKSSTRHALLTKQTSFPGLYKTTDRRRTQGKQPFVSISARRHRFLRRLQLTVLYVK